MDHINENKAAWEGGVRAPPPRLGRGHHERLQRETPPFFQPDIAAELKAMAWDGKAVARL